MFGHLGGNTHQAAVELRLGEKRTGQLEDLVGLAQLLVLAFEFLQALQLGRGDAILGPRIDLVALDPLKERLRHAADLRDNRFDGRPLRGVLASMLLHHAHRTLADLGGKLVRFRHGSILSEYWASTKWGAIHIAGRCRTQ